MPISFFTVHSILFCVDENTFLILYFYVFVLICLNLIYHYKNWAKIIRLQSYIVSVFEHFGLHLGWTLPEVGF